jgi:hypothetical protein
MDVVDVEGLGRERTTGRHRQAIASGPVPGFGKDDGRSPNRITGYSISIPASDPSSKSLTPIQ